MVQTMVGASEMGRKFAFDLIASYINEANGLNTKTTPCLLSPKPKHLHRETVM